MASNTMNFGPEWMRRFPAKTTQPQNDPNARAPSPPHANPHLQDWNQPTSAASVSMPAFSYSSIAASNVRSQSGAPGASSTSGALAADGVGGSGSIGASSFAADSLNPFKYSKELMLSLYKPTGLPIEFERHDIMTSEESLKPMSSQPFSDQELKLLSGNVNSEVARRTSQPGEGPQERTQGQRRESFSNVGEHSSGRYDRSDKSTTHLRNYDSRHGAAGSRPRNLNNEGRSHSFRRTELVEREREHEREREREPAEDDGLWNSPVGNAVGSFDANGVFRIVGEGEGLQPLEALEETAPESATKEAEEAAAKDQGDRHHTVNVAPLSQSLQERDKTDFAVSEQHAGQDLYDDKDDREFPGALTTSTTKGSNALRDEDDNNSFAANQLSVQTAAPTTLPRASFESLAVEMSKWLYRDPSGSIQGPFLSEEMHEWYKGGFFSPDLFVRREQDQTFEPLGSLIRRVGSDDEPFLIAGVVRQEQGQHPANVAIRTSIPSLAQNRMPLSQMNQPSGWIGMSAPTTPSTPSFGVDRMFLQQQHQHQQQLQQQHSSGDLFSGSNGLGQQRVGFGPAQDPAASGAGAVPGLDSRWGSGLFGRQSMEPNAGWSGDQFPRAPMASMPGAHTPLGAPQYMDQQQRLHHQEIERQQYMQLLQRQSQMQAMLHQQQFMAAQQQFGNDPHALAQLLAQQQAQQRQLQMRYQQLQFAGPLGQDQSSTPGDTAIPWGRMAQPTSPWTTSIIPSSSDNYFDLNKGEGNQMPHTLQRHDQPQFHQQAPSQLQQQPFQPFQQAQEPSEHLRHEKPLVAMHPSNESKIDQVHQPQEQQDEHRDDTLTRMENLAVSDNKLQNQGQAEVVDEKKPLSLSVATAAEANEDEANGPAEFADESNANYHENPSAETEQASAENVWQDDHDYCGSVEADVSENASWTTADSSLRTVKAAAPAPWAKSMHAEEEPSSERKGPTLREILEMEAKKAEAVKAERQAQMSSAGTLSGHNNLADFTKGMSGAPAWSSTAPTTPKKKTLKEIQQEEEAAMKKARASQQPSSGATGTGTGQAAIVASGSGTGSIGRRYADTIGPRPTSVTATSGPWGSSTTNSAGSTKPTLVTRSSAVFASNPSLNSPTAGTSVSRSPDTNSWIEVGSNKRDNGPGSSSNATPAAPISRSATMTSNHSSNQNPNEPRPPSEDFMRWCRQALKGLHQGVVLEDFIQMLLTFPLNPDPMTVEIIQDSIYASSSSLNGRQFADEFIKRRKADAYPNGGGPFASGGSSAAATLGQSGNGGPDSSFKVVSKKGKKKGTA
ncbi:hypothetical protein BGX28_001968 [Mortierella sp. GBA30]|nr:hypothetical protein BGX28_001968 [Mortierella sp. GBA30]